MKPYGMRLMVVALMLVAGWSQAQAANLTWDANGATAGQTDGAGTWLNANMWWDGAGNVNWNNATPDNAIIGNGGAGGIITLGYVTAGSVTFGTFTGTYTLTGSSLAQSGGITVNGNGAVTIASIVDGTGGITKNGSGVLTLSNNANPRTGNTLISNGKVTLGAQYALWQSPYDTTGSTGAIGLDRGTQTAPVLGGLAGNADLATAVTGYASVTALTLNPQTGTSISYSGVIANGSGNTTLTKTGDGSQTLTGANAYSGVTDIYDGTLALSGTSGTALNSAFTVRGGTLSLDNSTAWANRLTDGTALSLGSLTLTSSNGAGIQSETVGATTFAVGGKVSVNNGSTGGDQTTLALGAVTRSAGAAIDFVGTGGTLGGGANSPNVTSTGAFPSASNGILPWGTVGGTQWAEDNANSIRAYSGAFEDPTIAASDATKNAQLTGSGTMASAKSFNSLNVIASGAGQSLSLGGTLTLPANNGGILKSGADAYTISASSGNITAGNQLIAHVDGGALTISSPLNTAILNIAKGGTGDLILSGTRVGTMSGAIGIAGGQLEFQGAQTTLSGTISGAGGITVNLNAGQKLIFGGQNKTYSGPTIVKGGFLQMGTGWNQQSIPSVGGNATFGGTQGQGWTSNFELNGGILSMYWDNGLFLGTGPGQIKLTGGISGVSMMTNPRRVWTINNDANYEVVWGAVNEAGNANATGFFNPSTFVMNDSNAGDYFQIPNKIDLNGTTRTIRTDHTTHYGTLTGIIRTSSGTAGLTKTGAGELRLSAANTYNGVVTVNQGRLTVTANLANGGSPSALGASGNAAANLLLAPGTTLRYSGGAASSDRSFTINGTVAGDSASLDASGTGAINFTSTASPAFGTVDQARTLILTGTQTGANTLAANLADNGTGALSVTNDWRWHVGALRHQ